VLTGLTAALVLADPGLPSQLAVILLNPANWGSGRPPADWQIKVVHGKPEISSCADGAGSCLHLRSLKSSFGLEREVDVDPYENRYLTWRWKVTALPSGGDFRHASTDDQAAQVLVGFADRRVLTYIWDSTAPKGTMQNASSIPLLHIHAVVCESGPAETNRWVPEARDVAADYEHAYGKAAPHVKGLRIQINSQHTGSMAESYFGEVIFRSKPPE
jgi:hypothetical protein